MLRFQKEAEEEQIFLQEFNIVYTILNRSLERLYLFIEEEAVEKSSGEWNKMI